MNEPLWLLALGGLILPGVCALVAGACLRSALTAVREQEPERMVIGFCGAAGLLLYAGVLLIETWLLAVT